MPKSKAFKKLLANVEETYLGKPVEKRFRKRYGLIYDKRETESLAFAIAKSKGIKID